MMSIELEAQLRNAAVYLRPAVAESRLDSLSELSAHLRLRENQSEVCELVHNFRVAHRRCPRRGITGSHTLKDCHILTLQPAPDVGQGAPQRWGDNKYECGGSLSRAASCAGLFCTQVNFGQSFQGNFGQSPIGSEPCQ